MTGWIWRRVRRQLDRVVPAHRSAAVIGDLQEDYARRRVSMGAIRARVWLWRETRSLTRAYRAAASVSRHPWRPGAGFLSDIRFALRRLRAAPAFTIFAVLTLALGIGATTAIYSIIRAAMSPPAGVTTLDRLVTITHSSGGSVPMIALSLGDFHDLHSQQTAFQDVAGWTYLRVAVAASGNNTTAWGEVVTGRYFQVLGVETAAGRLLQPADDEPGATPVAVISYGLWQRVFGGARDAVGRLIKVNGVTFEVVGVASREFAGLFNSGLVPTAVWMPLRASGNMPGVREREGSSRSSRWIQVRARLKEGVSFEDGRADVLRVAAQLDQNVPLEGSDRTSYRTNRRWVVRRTADTYINEGADRVVEPMAATVMAAVALVLLVACSNLANLMLARGAGRREESAIRLALGASRGRLLRSEITESLLLGIAGGLAGVGVAQVVLVLIGSEGVVGNGASLRFVNVWAMLRGANATSPARAVTSSSPTRNTSSPSST